ncbi:ShlB/FhaC/HecB family hemolysin secretion/activation protein [filamentous cyanobacterium CCP3]|nr:ShlB/FhaC/HecB family hemolysin secretion/activation protein [filamentous cyanobacterium CCP3]
MLRNLSSCAGKLIDLGFIVQAPIFGVFLIFSSLTHATASQPSGDQSEAVPATMAEWVAQSDPSQNRLPEPGVPVEPLPEPPVEETVPAPPVEPPPNPEIGDPNLEQILIRQIDITGSTVFTAEDLRQAVEPFENQLLTIAELQAIAAEITQLYLSQGYITSRAELPEQTIDDGVVQIQIMEGGLEAIQVDGTTRLADYVRSRVGLGAQTPLNQLHLEDQLRLLASDPLFDSVRGSLRPGTVPGQSLLVVEVQEADPFSGSIGVDTLSPRSVGQYRIGATLQYLNLAGLGDRLAASAYRTTTGGSQVYDLNYQVPISPTNGTVSVRLAPNSFRITDPQEPGFGLGISGSTDIYEASVRQPLIRTPREELALSLGYRYRDGSTLISGIVTPPTRSNVLSFGQDYTRRDPTGAWGLRSQFRFGTAVLDATGGAPVRADNTFFSWLGQVQRVQVLGPDHLLFINADLQLTPDRLLTSEQFFVGGGQSVRGFYQNARYGDNGVRLSIEDRITLVRDGENGAPILQVMPFVDAGYVWNNNPSLPNFSQNLIVGTGAGVLYNPFPGLSTRVDLGIPLVTLDEISSDRPSGLRVYFDARYQF